MFKKEFLSTRIKELRLSKSITVAEMAEQLGVSKQLVGHWETGYRIPPIETAINIADLFNVSLDYLTGRIDEKNPEDIHYQIDLKKYRYNPCGQCGNTVFSDEATFCKECGSSLLLYCGYCNKLNLPDSKFCEFCGKALRAPFPCF